MSFTLTPYGIALFSAALVSAVVAVISLRRRAVPGGGLFSLLMWAVVIWTFSSALESAAIGVRAKLAFSKLAYLGTVNVAPLFLLFVLRYNDPARRLPWLPLGALWIVPVATLVLAATNERHGLVWSSITPSSVAGSNMVIYGHGPMYWGSLFYYLALCLPAAFMLGRVILQLRGVYLLQTITVLAALAAPWVGAIFYLLPMNPFPGLDLVAMGFTVTGALLLLGMFRFRFLDLVPVARDVLMEKMVDGLVVLDSSDQIVDINPAARKVFGVSESVIGRPFGEAFPAWRGKLKELRAGADATVEATLPGAQPAQMESQSAEIPRRNESAEIPRRNESAEIPRRNQSAGIPRRNDGGADGPRETQGSRYFDLRASILRGRRGSIGGSFLVIREVTERKRIELEREKLIGDLQKAVADIKTLRGLLPICASCKKIRDDRGYWQNLEQYVSAHSEAQFSHSLCPECLHRLYPDIADQNHGEGGG
jgi:PAS domain-containing protein